MIETIEKLTCDKCGLPEIPGTRTVAFPIDRRSNGNDKDTVIFIGELCPKCMGEIIRTLAERIPMEQRRNDTIKLAVWREELR